MYPPLAPPPLPHTHMLLMAWHSTAALHQQDSISMPTTPSPTPSTHRLCCAEQSSPALLRQASHDGVQLLPEAHVQQAVSLIKDLGGGGY